MPWPTISTFSSASRLKMAVWSVEQLLVASCGEEGMRAVVSVCMQGRGAPRAALRSRAVVSDLVLLCDLLLQRQPEVIIGTPRQSDAIRGNHLVLLCDLLLLPHHDLDALVAERPVIQAHQVQSLVKALSRAGLSRPAALDLDRVVGHLLRHRAEVKQTGGAAQALRGIKKPSEVIRGN